jgi:triacylglycerol lipase
VDVNHLDLVGWINTARYKWAEIMGKEIQFRPATFYLEIADRLAREVEGSGDGQESALEREDSDDADTALDDFVAGPDGHKRTGDKNGTG